MLRQSTDAIADVAPLLASVDDSAIVRPHTDPHAAAVTALLVADYLGQPELRDELAAAGVTSESVQDLRRLSRAVLAIVTELGGEYLSVAHAIPSDLAPRGHAVRTAITAALVKARPDDDEVKMWLEAIRLGAGVVDLVFDLRALAELCTRHLPEDQEGTATTLFAASAALSTADAIELALRSGDTPERTHARDALARLWTVFQPAYEVAARAGRAVTRDHGHEMQFPPLALVASHRRSRRRPFSLVPAPSLSLVPAPAPSLAPAPAPAPSLAPAPASASPSAPPSARRPPPLPPRVSTPPGETRGTKRHTVEIEVGIASDSNFYVGFTENLSEGGVFVATYALKPLGEKVEVALAFANGDELRVPGVVRWLRNASADNWPGMGVQFEALSPDDEDRIRKFLALRDPLFYDD